MSSAKIASAFAKQEIQSSDGSHGSQPVSRPAHAKRVVLISDWAPRDTANSPKREPCLQARPAAVISAPWTSSVRVDPKRKLVHDFRNTMQELVYAAERADNAAVIGLANCLEGYLQEALQRPKRAA